MEPRQPTDIEVVWKALIGCDSVPSVRAALDGLGDLRPLGVRAAIALAHGSAAPAPGDAEARGELRELQIRNRDAIRRRLIPALRSWDELERRALADAMRGVPPPDEE